MFVSAAVAVADVAEIDCKYYAIFSSQSCTIPMHLLYLLRVCDSLNIAISAVFNPFNIRHYLPVWLYRA